MSCSKSKPWQQSNFYAGATPEALARALLRPLDRLSSRIGEELSSDQSATDTHDDEKYNKNNLKGATVMTTLTKEISAYERMLDDLEAEHLGEWVLVRDEKLIGAYESFELAADDAVRRFGRGPYLIREVGGRPMSLPASVLYRPIHA